MKQDPKIETIEETWGDRLGKILGRIRDEVGQYDVPPSVIAQDLKRAPIVLSIEEAGILAAFLRELGIEPDRPDPAMRAEFLRFRISHN